MSVTVTITPAERLAGAALAEAPNMPKQHAPGAVVQLFGSPYCLDCGAYRAEGLAARSCYTREERLAFAREIIERRAA